MSDEKSWPPDFDPREALAEVDGVSGSMVEGTEMPRLFGVAVAAVVSAGLALVHAVPLPALLGAMGLLVPLLLWYWLVMRGRPKARPVLLHSGRYAGFFLLLMLLASLGNWWEARSWWEVLAKWIVLFGLGSSTISRMRTDTIKNRLKDANERPV